MYTQLSFVEIYTEIFICGSLVASYMTFLCYRLLAASPARTTFRGWKRYVLFYLAAALVAPSAYPFDDVSYLRGLLLYLLFSAPVLVSGAIGIAKNVSRLEVLLSFIVEAALFPVWFYAVFKVLMALDFV